MYHLLNQLQVFMRYKRLLKMTFNIPLSKGNIYFLFNQHWKTLEHNNPDTRKTMSLKCAQQTTSYFPGGHGPLVAWSVVLNTYATY